MAPKRRSETAAQARMTRSAAKAHGNVVFQSLPDKQPAKKQKTAAEKGKAGKKSTAAKGESKAPIEVAEEGSNEDDDGGGGGGAQRPMPAPSMGRRRMQSQSSKQ